MNHAVNVRVFVEQPIKGFLICDIEFFESWSLPAQNLYPVDCLLGRVVEIVGDDDFVASFQQRKRRKGSDVACASSSNSVSPCFVADWAPVENLPSDQAGSFSHTCAMKRSGRWRVQFGSVTP